MASIERIEEADGVITVFFNSPYEVEVDDIQSQIPDLRHTKIRHLSHIKTVVQITERSSPCKSKLSFVHSLIRMIS